MIEPSFGMAARLVALAALALMAAAPAVGHAQTAGVDPEARRILKRMTDYLESLQQFSVDTQNTLEAVLETGQKIQFDSAASAMVLRPNKLRAERNGDLVSQVFYFDGKTLTLYNPSDKFYASVVAPPTIEPMLDFARDQLDIVAPASDFLYRNAYELLMQDTTSGFVVGKAVIGGVKCDQLAFNSPDVHWQVWIADGDKPLPRKYVVTTKGLAGQPQYTVVMTNWNVSPNLNDARFSFVPPQGAKRIDFAPLEASRAPAR